jgi:hypothetical protein
MGVPSYISNVSLNYGSTANSKIATEKLFDTGMMNTDPTEMQKAIASGKINIGKMNTQKVKKNKEKI